MTTKCIVSPAQAYLNQQDVIADAAPTLKRLYDTVGYSIDLNLNQWAQWFSVALEFKPDLIVEFGRHHGNSTCIFTDAANRIDGCRVVSLCWSDVWKDETAPKLAHFLPESWFKPLDARKANILNVDAKEVIGSSKRVLVCWDAHGYDIAEYMLSTFLPTIWPNEHLFLMHDISDTRYSDPRNSYEGTGVWRGGMSRGENNESVLHIENMVSSVAQTLCAYDFTKRNGVEMRSADHSLHTELTPDQVSSLSQKLGEFFSTSAYWWYWSLSELATDKQIHFPAAPERVNSDELDLLGNLSPTSLNIDRLQAHILQMQASPFWKLRNVFKKLRGQKPD